MLETTNYYLKENIIEAMRSDLAINCIEVYKEGERLWLTSRSEDEELSIYRQCDLRQISLDRKGKPHYHLDQYTDEKLQCLADVLNKESADRGSVFMVNIMDLRELRDFVERIRNEKLIDI